MALLDDVFKGNLMTGLALGFGAYLLAPTLGQVLRPAAKAIIKGGIIAYQGLAEFGEMASEILAEAQAEMEPQGDHGALLPASPAGSSGRSSRARAKT
jgi:hypothetical protein